MVIEERAGQDLAESKPPTEYAGRNRLVQLAYRFVWDRADAEDAVQNALTLAHQKRSDLRDESKRWSWLCRIVVRQCFLLRRVEQRRTQRERSSLPAISDRRADSIASSERAELVRWAMDRLPPQQRTAITLRHLEEMPYDRIAAIMEISPSTARVHVRAAREAMRSAIMGRDRDYQLTARQRGGE